MTKTKAERDQYRRFVAAAREAETDESLEAFEHVFANIVPPKRAGEVAIKPHQAPDRKAQ